ncbi:MAG: SLBB domain-containing protein [Tenericutes bacterium]|jgi:competence protein ComEA|nr:SLBB domain-containing protein [Mycoplasmatota bacterium]
MNWIKNNIGIFLILIGIIGFVIVNNFISKVPVNEMNYQLTTESLNVTADIQVEIKGEVHLPGIYACGKDERVLDLINKAGGLTEDAFVDDINRSQKLEDEMVIVIPRKMNNSTETPNIQRYINVEVKGEVLNPGLYKLKENAIINDLVEDAGGFSINANIALINLAQKLSEGDSIIIKSLDDMKLYVEIKGQVTYPGVYYMEASDLVIDLINAAGGLLEDAHTEDINLVELLSNHQVITIESKNEKENTLAVDIKGAVKNPGVYFFNQGDRVVDVINLAGGFDENADYEHINLSEFVQDEQLIIISTIESEMMMAVDLKGEVKYPGVYYLKEGSRVLDLIRMAGGFRPDADSISLNLSEILNDEDLIIVDKVVTTQDNLFVEIRGEVYFPGIYTMRPGDRLLMLINRAGGFTGDADQNEVNLTRILLDEEIIVIPSQFDENIYVSITGEVFNPGTYYVTKGIDVVDLIYIAGGLTINANIAIIDFSQSISESISIHIPSIESQVPQLPNTPVDKVNINTAGLEQLQTLSGIGIILGERIIEYRDINGGFNSIEEIMNVSGIKEYIYEKIKDNITV